MKCYLRKVPEGVIATIEGPLAKGEPYYNFDKGWFNINAPYPYKSSNFEKVIGSTFGVGKELMVNYKGQIMAELVGKKKKLELDKQYYYTETETQIIIQL